MNCSAVGFPDVTTLHGALIFGEAATAGARTVVIKAEAA
jgi:hypothetical protein